VKVETVDVERRASEVSRNVENEDACMSSRGKDGEKRELN